MPRSKRAKIISLTKVTKKDDAKSKLVRKIQKACDKFHFVWVFKVANVRTQALQDLRTDWNDSRFFFGKNRVCQVALGRSAGDEYAENLHELSARLRGQCGLLFTNRSREEVEAFFASYGLADYARSGSVATEDFVVPAGPLPQFNHALEPYLRSLGLPCKLDRGVVTVEREFRVCKAGKPLSSEQARLLKAFDQKQATMHFVADSLWTGGKFEQLVDDGQRHLMDANDDGDLDQEEAGDEEMEEVAGDELDDE